MTTVTAIRTTTVLAPMRRPLRTASGAIERMPLVLVELLTDGRVSGHAYVEVYAPELLPALAATIEALGGMIVGRELAPRDLHAYLLLRLRLWGVKNLVGVALGGLDMAWWDAFARLRDEPLYATLGCAPRPLAAYMSAGMYDEHSVIDVVADAITDGFDALKIKLGFPTLAEDLAVVRAAKRALGGRALMVDYNQCLSPQEALRRGRVLDDEGLAWIEEPLMSDDYTGHAALADALVTPVQFGENFHSPEEMRAALAVHAMDYVMPDPQFIRGVTGWLEAAALAHQARMECSSHLFVEASSHLLCATPTAHYLEYLDVTTALVREPFQVVDGRVTPPQRPGLGIEWDAEAVARHRA